MNKKDILGLLIAVIVFGTVIGLSLWYFNQNEVQYLQGQVEAKQINVAPKVAGRVKTIYVEEGEDVKKGQLLLELESTEIDAKMAQAQAAKSAAQAQANKAQAGARIEQIQGAYNLWQQAKAAAELAEKTYTRVQNLYNDKVVPAQKKDEAYAKMKAYREQE
ncbi:MAG: hemolysin secretion protein D, partial [Flavobacteriales bacterium]